MPGEYKVALDTDDGKYGGFHRVDSNVPHFTFPEDFAGRKNSIKVKESHNILNFFLVLIISFISILCLNLCYVGQWAVNLPLLCDSIQI